MEGAPKPRRKPKKGDVLYEFNRFKTGLISFLLFVAAGYFVFRGLVLTVGQSPDTLSTQSRMTTGPIYLAAGAICLLVSIYLVNALSRPEHGQR